MSTPRCAEHFSALYRRDAQGVAFCPCRVVPIGAHSDHQNGMMTGLAIDRGVRAAYGVKRNGVVEAVSLQFDRRAQWHILQTPERPCRDWADYLRGATLALQRRYTLHNGVCAVIDGELPIGGLSSSAAVVVAFLQALADVNGIAPTADELVQMAFEAEKDYVGVSIGAMDPYCVVHARKDHLLCLDAQIMTHEQIAAPASMPDYRIAVLYSGLPRSLASTDFNRRVDEMKAAAFALRAWMGGDCPGFVSARLRDVPREVYEQYKHRLPDGWRNRAEHFYTEFDRVQQGREAWRRGDLITYGRLCTESGRSSIDNYQSGSEQLIALCDILRTTDGVYGGRFAGAGYRGCCIALIDPAYAQHVDQTVRAAYLKRFPSLADAYSFRLVQSADGVGGLR